MIVYMTQGQKTVLSRITVEGLPLHYLSVGRGYFARRRALHCLRQMYDSGVRRCICADVYLLSLAKQVDITSYPVLPLRLALLGSLLDILCPGGLQNAAAVLRCGPGGEEQCVCGGKQAEVPKGMQPGEVYIYGPKGSNVYLQKDGTIELTGRISIRGQLLINGQPYKPCTCGEGGIL